MDLCVCAVVQVFSASIYRCVYIYIYICNDECLSV